MTRRNFMEAAAGAVLGGDLATNGARVAQAGGAPAGTAELPVRVLGKTGVRVTAVGFGAWKFYMIPEDTAARLVDAAVNAGINYVDTAHDYFESERILGRALRGKRQKVFLSTKTKERSRAGVERQLAESLRNLQTDYVDVYQMHMLMREEEVEQIFGPGGAIEAFVQAKKEGKVRYLGFSGHYDPQVHAAMIARYDFDVVTMPLNAADPHYVSFEEDVLPRAAQKQMGIVAMKIFADAMLLRAITVDECLRYTLSLPVSCAIMGMTTLGQLEDNLRVARNFRPLSAEEKTPLLAKTAQIKGAQLEYYKRGA
jgi:aryl-alcohol dehydrogenase-like predicted oxidoreductase